jgi:hypothetical protein
VVPPRTRVPAFARASAPPWWLRVLVLALAVAVATFVGATIATGRVAPSARPVDPELLVRIAAPVRDAPLRAPTASAGPIRLDPIADFSVTPPGVGARPAPDMPQPLGVVVVPTPTPPPAQPATATGGGGSGGGSGGGGSVGSSRQVSGSASWYCQPGVSACHNAYSGGFYAAAGPALRVGDWRGRAVRVCGGGGCVTVRLIDWCHCYGTRVIDLYSDAFRQIAPLSSGTTRVTVSW